MVGMPNDAPRSWLVRRLGAPADALALEPARPRPPGPGEARVAIGAVGLNFPDLLLCAGRYQERPDLPFSPGFEAAGVVTETGPGAGLSPGGHVLVVPELPNGAMQESITVSAAELYPVPDTMPVTVAAALHIAYQTAHVGMHHRAALRAGETLRLVIQGRDVYRYPRPLIQALHDDSVNRGPHVIWAGGDYDSHLLVPVTPT